MPIAVARDVVAAILADAARTPDREVCGLLIGNDLGIEKALATANVAADPARSFEIDPAALFLAIRAERAGGPTIAGYYHSHPNGDTMPSARDAAVAAPGRYWLIAAAGRWALWRSARSGAVHGVFDPVDAELG